MPVNTQDPSVQNWRNRGQPLGMGMAVPPPPLPQAVGWGAGGQGPATPPLPEPISAPQVDPSVPPLPQPGPPVAGPPPPMPQTPAGPAAPPTPPPLPQVPGAGNFPSMTTPSIQAGAAAAAPEVPPPLPGGGTGAVALRGGGSALSAPLPTSMMGSDPATQAMMTDPALKVIRDIARAKWGAKLGDQTKNPRDMQIPNQGGGITVPGAGGLGATMLVPVTHPDGRVEMVQVDNPDMKAPPTELGALGHMSPEGVKQLMQGQLQKGVTAGMNQMQPMSPNEALAQSIGDWKKQAGIMSPDEKAHSLLMQSQESKQASGEKVAGLEVAGKEKVATIEAESRKYETMAKMGMGTQQLAEKFIADRVAKGQDTTPEQLKAFTDTMSQVVKDTQQGLQPGGTPPIPTTPGTTVPTVAPQQLGLGAGPGQLPMQSHGLPLGQAPDNTQALAGTISPDAAAAAKRKADMDAINAIGANPAVRQVLQDVTGATIDQSGAYAGSPKWQHEPGMFSQATASKLISAVAQNDKLLKNPAMMDSLVSRIANMPGAPTKEQLLDQISRAVINRLHVGGQTGDVQLGQSGINVGMGGPAAARGVLPQFGPANPTIAYPGIGTSTYSMPSSTFATGGLINQMPTFGQKAIDLSNQEAQGAGTALLQAILKLGPRAPGQR
jgi:hypothetical protein